MEAEKNGYGNDKIDKQVACIRYESGSEKAWEKEGNTLVEKHPYLTGYAFLIGFLVVLSVTHLSAFAISFLFLFLISDIMTNEVHRHVPFIPRTLLFSVLYIVVIVLITILSYKTIPSLLKNFPEMSSQLQTRVVNELRDANTRWDLSQYLDIDELKGAVVNASSTILKFFVDGLTPLYKGIIQFIFALAINLLLYFESGRIEQTFNRNPNSLMSFLYNFFRVRLKIFYFYFKRVMSGQFVIALINTAISSVVILALGLPHPILMIFIVFFCGLFPVVGNLISNSVLTINAFVSIGIWGTVVCLILLAFVHKLEYFLNSRIIGGIVRLPMTVSLAALILSEVMLGIPGLVLAIPLALFFRHEFEHIPGVKKDPAYQLTTCDEVLPKASGR